MSKYRVAITGIGLVTPVGTTTQATWQGLLAGKSGISHNPALEAVKHDPAVSGQVDLSQEQLESVLTPAQQRKCDRFIQLGLVAGHEAMADAKLTKEFPTQRDRFGCYLGVGVGGLDSIHDATRTFDTKGGRALGPLLLPKMLANEAPAWLCMEHNLQGPMLATTNACASGSDAIGLAFQKIRDGYADYMLAGGTESCVTGPSFAGFANMRALSSWQGDAAGASRPFSGDRTGFVMAEGAGVLVLERLDLAEARGAKIYAEVVGYGATCDAFHFTAIHPEGRGGKLAIRHALDDAGVKPEDIGYINAHGTGTPMNDAAETLICKAVFGEHVSAGKEGHCVISSSKSMTGHMLGAAGGVEAAVAALALHEGVVPPTINLDTPDPACDLDYVPHVKRDVHAEYAMSTSFGFGGGNAALIIKKY